MDLAREANPAPGVRGLGAAGEGRALNKFFSDQKNEMDSLDARRGSGLILPLSLSTVMSLSATELRASELQNAAELRPEDELEEVGDSGITVRFRVNGLIETDESVESVDSVESVEL